MKEIVATVGAWKAAGKSVAIARVVSTWGSAPRRPGATMAISSEGELAGSVSGGCIEGTVRDEALAVLAGDPARIVDYGVDNETAWSVGLSCGGSVRVLVQKLPSFWDTMIDGILAGDRMVFASAINGDKEFNALVRRGNEILHDAPADAAMPVAMTDALAAADVDALETGEIVLDDVAYFLHVVRPPEQLIVIGGSDIAVHLIRYADQLGFYTVLVDPRQVFTDRSRFEVSPARIETAWPQEIMPSLSIDSNTYAVLLTHDPKIDDPAIHVLLRSEAAYIGALGSGRTQQKRRERLVAAGFRTSEIDRIHGPVGLDIGAATPAEIALSIVAEMVKVKRRVV